MELTLAYLAKVGICPTFQKSGSLLRRFTVSSLGACALGLKTLCMIGACGLALSGGITRKLAVQLARPLGLFK